MLTDGTVLVHADGTESKRVRHQGRHRASSGRSGSGSTVGFLSARTSAATAQRAAQLGITLVHQGVPSKLETYEQIVATA